MKKIYLLAIVALLSSCMKQVENPTESGMQPEIFPDYVGVTIPAGIAPMDFGMKDDAFTLVDVVATGSKGGELHVQGEYADFDVEEWHDLTERNIGGQISFVVSALKNGRWTRYKSFVMNVSRHRLDDYGITYRRIAPGYECGGDIGIYQRDIHSFDEEPMFTVDAVPGQCMNCHTANRASADEFLMHVRGEKSGTMLQQNGRQTWLNTKTDSTKANMSYSYWHPSGNYIVSSVNTIFQAFFVGNKRRIEVYDLISDVLVYDVKKNELLLDNRLQTPDFETYPVFSADGTAIFFSTSKLCNVPVDYEKMKYSLCKIGFDPANGTFGERVDTLLNAEALDKSFTFARPSFDGKWLMYNVMDCGNFPVNHKESDLWIMDLRNGNTRALKEVNSDDSESFHNWSSQSHWFVFSSRRIDGMYTNAYFACIGDDGKATKPFLLPQRNPKKHYRESLDSYNCPEFTKTKVCFDARQAGNECLGGSRKQVDLAIHN